MTVSVFLHGNRIAILSDDAPDRLLVSLADWDTPTTRSRLSSLVKGLADARAKRVHDQPVGDASRALTDDGCSYRYPAGLGVSSRKGVVRVHDARGETAISADGWHAVEL